MNIQVKKYCVLFTFLLPAFISMASDENQNAESSLWSYSGDNGPENWARLSPDFSDCNGKNQSPVNLTGFIEAELDPLQVSYEAGGNEIVNNSHTLQVNYQQGSKIVVDGIDFMLKQFHFHVPSENLVKGNSYPMEAHLVHADSDGNLAVVAVMFKEGKTHPLLLKIWAMMPHKVNDRSAIIPALNAQALLPADTGYYRFNGSLTTPPCSEGVRWLVMKETVSASREQIEAFTDVIKHSNNRPVQTMNARTVLH